MLKLVNSWLSYCQYEKMPLLWLTVYNRPHAAVLCFSSGVKHFVEGAFPGGQWGQMQPGASGNHRTPPTPLCSAAPSSHLLADKLIATHRECRYKLSNRTLDLIGCIDEHFVWARSSRPPDQADLLFTRSPMEIKFLMSLLACWLTG